MKYDVFISYSRKDSEIADHICDVLKENKITYFIDRKDISGGEEYLEELADNIESCSLFLFIGSYNSLKDSIWTPKELAYAVNNKDRFTIIPYMIDDEPLPKDIKLLLSNINVTNINEHPIETTLLEDIKKAKERFLQMTGKDDLKMAKTIANNITSSKHDIDYCVDLLNKLGDNTRGINNYTYPEESLIYFSAALSLLEKTELSNNKYQRREYQIASICSKIANIYYSQEKYDEAVSNLEKTVKIYSSSEDFGWMYDDLSDSLLTLCEIIFLKRDYEKVEQLCSKLKDVLLKSSRKWNLDTKVMKMTGMLVKTLRAQQKFEEAEKIQDEILILFRNQVKTVEFINILVRFAIANAQEEQYNYAEKYLTEAYELDNNNLEVISKLADALEHNAKIEEAKIAYEKAFQLIMRFPLTGKNGRDFLKYHKQIINFLDRNRYYEDIDKYFKLAIAKYSIDIYKEEIEKTTIGNIYEKYADYLTNCQHYHKSSHYLNKCLKLTKKMANQDAIDSNMFRIYTKRSINDLGLGYIECASKDLNEALRIYKNMNDEYSYKIINSINTLYTLWKKYTEIGFSEGTELIKKSLIESKNIKVDDLGDKVTFLTHMGWYLLLMEEYAQAQQPLEDALKAEQKLKRSESDINNAKNNLARLYINIDKLDKAEELLNEALSAFAKLSAKNDYMLHNYAESQNYLGRLRMKQNRYTEAENYFEQSLDNYIKAAKLENKWEEDVKETSLLLEQVKALQED